MCIYSMKTGIYLAQAIQVAFFLGLVAQIANCVRHLIWMRESRNTMVNKTMSTHYIDEFFTFLIFIYR